MNGERFLDKLYKDLHMSEIVMHSVGDEKDKLKKIQKYMERLEKTHDMGNDEHRKNMLKELYYKKYVIEENNIPYGVDAEQIINAQKKSLSRWLDYLLDSNARYPMWTKYWAFQGMLKIGTYDEASDSYMKRSQKTLAPFIEVNPEALAKSIGMIQKYVNKEPIEEEMKKLIESGSFNKIYTKLIKLNKKQVNVNNDDGIWEKYSYQSEEEAEMSDYPEYERLYDSLQGYNTGWCTAGDIEMAKDQICGIRDYPGGDFYVYYTKDKKGEYKVPRIAIRLNDSYDYEDEDDLIDEEYDYNNGDYGYNNEDYIGEIRGVADSQNLEEGLETVVEEKLKELYLSERELRVVMKKVNNAKQLTEINRKTKKKIPLTVQEILFLYELKQDIITFGWEKDPRINKIIKSRNSFEDLGRLDNMSLYIPVIRGELPVLLKRNEKEMINQKILRWASDRDVALKIFKEKQDYLTYDEQLELAKINGLVLQYYRYRCINPMRLNRDELEAYLLYGLSPNDLNFVETCVKENLFAIKYIKNTSVNESIKKTIKDTIIPVNLFDLDEKRLSDFIVWNVEPGILLEKRYFGKEEETKYPDEYSIASIPKDNYAQEKFEIKHKNELEKIKETIKDKTSILENVKQDINILKYVDKSYFEDESFVLELLKINENTMYFLPSEIKDNKDFILKAIKTNYKVSVYLINQFSNDLELLKQCIDIDVNVIRGLPDYLQDEEIALVAINKTVFSYLYLKDDLKNNDKIINVVCEKVRKNKNYMKYQGMMKKLFLEIISKNENYLKLFDLKAINELHISTKNIIDANPRIILVVPSFRNNKNILLYALSKDGSLLLEDKLRNMTNLFLLLDGTDYINQLTETKLASTRK